MEDTTKIDNECFAQALATIGAGASYTSLSLSDQRAVLALAQELKEERAQKSRHDSI